MKCKTCGVDKKFHDKWLWNARVNMWIAHTKANKLTNLLIKRMNRK
jgi:hypothetical protein